MKKFSKITNQKVNEEPKLVETKVTEEDVFRSSVFSLIENILSIRTYGPVDRYLRAGSIKIAGKEMLVDALVDLVSNNNLKEKVKILEGLKSRISDWESIDNTIDEVTIKIDESNGGKMLNHRNKIANLFKLYGDDKETILEQVDRMINKITNPEKAFWRAITCEQMATEGKLSRTILKEMANKFHFKAKQLGYKK